MSRALRLSVRVLGALLVGVALGLAIWGVPAPPSLTVEDMPRIGWRHVWRSLGVVDGFSARRQFAGWIGHERSMLVAAGTTNRFVRIDGPGRAPIQVAIPERAFGVQTSRDVSRPWVTYALDDGGSERYRLFRYDVATGDSVPLTASPARAYAAGIDPAGRRLAFTSSERNGVDTDVYVVEVDAMASPERVFAPGGDWWLSGWTNDGRLLANRHVGIEQSLSGLLDPATGTLTPLFTDRPDGVVIRAAARARQGDVMFLAADLDGEYVGIHALDPASGETTSLTPELRWDVEDLDTLADGRTLVALVNEDSRHRLVRLDLVTGAIEPVPGWPGGFPLRLAAHPALPLVAIDVIDEAGVVGVWTYDAVTGAFDAWSVERVGTRVPPPEVVHYPTFDRDAAGEPRRISAVVLRPREPMAQPQPVIVDIHGGPTDQALALVQPQDTIRGPRPVVIRPNVRGSTGYGRTFASLDDRRQREDAVRDIGALLDWIDAQPDLDGARVALMGGSYGGYLMLAAMAAYDDRIRCGVDMFGITDFPAFLAESDQGHFGQAQRGEFGDPADPAMAAYLQSISPITLADRITSPLLIYQGANDVRVKPSQSRRLAERLRAAGGTVTYLEAANEGHGLTQPMTQFYFGVAMIEFMTRCLGSG